MNPKNQHRDSLPNWAYVSYTPEDAVWGKWVVAALESYEVPDGITLPNGEPCPRFLTPISSTNNRSRKRRKAARANLLESRWLVVICSPHASSCKMVEQDVIDFKRAGGEDQVIALIISGDVNPEAADSCFPKPMIFKIAEDGNLTSESADLVGADIRDRLNDEGRKSAVLGMVASLVGMDYENLCIADKDRPINVPFPGSESTPVAKTPTQTEKQPSEKKPKQENVPSLSDEQNKESLIGSSEKRPQHNARKNHLKHLLAILLPIFIAGILGIFFYKRFQTPDAAKQGVKDPAIAEQTSGGTSSGAPSSVHSKSDDLLDQIFDDARQQYPLTKAFSPKRAFLDGLISEGVTYYRDSLKSLKHSGDQTNIASAKRRLASCALLAGVTEDNPREELREAKLIFEKLAKKEPGNMEYQRELGLIQLEQGNLYADTGEEEQALASLDSGIKLLSSLREEGTAALPEVVFAKEKLSTLADSNEGTNIDVLTDLAGEWSTQVDENPDSVQLQEQLADTFNNLGRAQMRSHDPAGALKSFQRVAKIRERIVEADPENAISQGELARTLVTLGNLHKSQDSISLARDSYLDAVFTYNKALELEDALPVYREEAAEAYRVLGTLFTEEGNYKDAFTVLSFAVAEAQKLHEESPEVSEYMLSWALAHIELGCVLGKDGKPAEALVALKEAEAQLEHLMEVDQGSDYRVYQARGILKRAAILGATERNDEAVVDLRKGIVILKDALTDHADDLSLQRQLAFAHREFGAQLATNKSYLEAVNEYNHSINLLEGVALIEPTLNMRIDLADYLGELGDLYELSGSSKEARASQSKALVIWEALSLDNAEDERVSSGLDASREKVAKLEAPQNTKEE